MEYIYIFYVREHKNIGESVYKIGRTKSDVLNRLKNYPKGTIIQFVAQVTNSVYVENIIIKEFKKIFKQRSEYGTEYFEGEISSLIQEILKIISQCGAHTSEEREENKNLKKYSDLYNEHEKLLINYEKLKNLNISNIKYEKLLVDHESLKNDYEFISLNYKILENNYEILKSSYNGEQLFLEDLSNIKFRFFPKTIHLTKEFKKYLDEELDMPRYSDLEPKIKEYVYNWNPIYKSIEMSIENDDITFKKHKFTEYELNNITFPKCKFIVGKHCEDLPDNFTLKMFIETMMELYKRENLNRICNAFVGDYGQSYGQNYGLYNYDSNSNSYCIDC